jgi:hypothetical protein
MLLFVLDKRSLRKVFETSGKNYEGFEKEERVKQKDQGVRISRTTEHYASLSWSLNVKISYGKQNERYGGCQTEAESLKLHYF